MKHKNPLFSHMYTVNLVTDYSTSREFISAVIDGIKFSITKMFETAPDIHIKYIEDYNLEHDIIGFMNPIARIRDKRTSDLFEYINTNVYLCHYSSITSGVDNTLGACLTAYASYPALRLIDIPVIRLNKLHNNQENVLRHIAAHEMLHIHPLYKNKHCSNSGCLMSERMPETVQTQLSLCPQCTAQLQRFNSDMTFRHKITKHVMWNEIYYHVIKRYFKEQFSIHGLMEKNDDYSFILKCIKLYYRQLWLDQSK